MSQTTARGRPEVRYSGGTVDAWPASGREQHPRSRPPRIPGRDPPPAAWGEGGAPALTSGEGFIKRREARRSPTPELSRSGAASASPPPPLRARPAGEMLSCRLQCALALLSIALVLGTVSAAPSDPRLRQFLQKSLAAAAGKQVRAPRRGCHPGHPSGTPLGIPTALLPIPASPLQILASPPEIPLIPRFRSPTKSPAPLLHSPGFPAADPSSSPLHPVPQCPQCKPPLSHQTSLASPFHIPTHLLLAPIP